MAVFGNPAVDEVYRNGDLVLVPGGSAFYVSAAAAFLGAKVELFGNVGADYPMSILRWLRTHRVSIGSVRHTHGPSTRFRLTYHGWSRSLRVIHSGTRVTPSRFAVRWDAVHVGPVFGEVDNSLVLRARRHSKIVSLDIQGFIRDSTRNGSIRLVKKRLGRVLSSCDVVKASLQEAEVQTRARDPLKAAELLLSYGPRYAIITLAASGSLLAVKGLGNFRVPAYPESRVADPTGAGDGFVAGWVETMVSARDPVWASSVGSALASMMLRHFGTRKFLISRRELFRRSAWVYERVRRIC